MSKPTIRAAHYTEYVPEEIMAWRRAEPIRTTNWLKVTGEVIWEPGKEGAAELAVKAMADDLITQIREARVAIEAGS